MKKYILNQLALHSYLATPMSSSEVAAKHFDEIFAEDAAKGTASLSDEQLALIKSSISHARIISFHSSVKLLFDQLPEKDLTISQLKDWLAIFITQYHVMSSSIDAAQKLKETINDGFGSIKKHMAKAFHSMGETLDAK